MTNELKSQPLFVQIILGLILFAASLAMGWHAYTLYIQGKNYSSIETAGMSLMMIGGSFDPINFIWIYLPFTRKMVAAPAKFAEIGWIVVGVGFIPFLVGMIGRHITA